MAKWSGILVVLALVKAGPAVGPCDVKTTEPGVYCVKEERTLFPGSVKDGKCPNDGTDVAKVEICVKKHYICACAGCGKCVDDKAAPGACKCAQKLQEEESKSIVIWVCKSCGAKSPAKDAIKHDETKDAGKKVEFKKTCADSGKFPHGK